MRENATCTILRKTGKDNPSYCDKYRSPWDTDRETPTILRKYQREIIKQNSYEIQNSIKNNY